MSRRLAVPDSDDLPALIRNAFDALPAPDEQRLAAVRPQLSERTIRKRPARRLSWVLWLTLLGGGTVAAAWWLGDMRDENYQAAEPRMQQLAPEDNLLPDGRQNTGAKEKENKPEQPSPIIYQRNH